jgi:hypothetical protein
MTNAQLIELIDHKDDKVSELMELIVIYKKIIEKQDNIIANLKEQIGE